MSEIMEKIVNSFIMGIQYLLVLTFVLASTIVSFGLLIVLSIPLFIIAPIYGAIRFKESPMDTLSDVFKAFFSGVKEGIEKIFQ